MEKERLQRTEEAIIVATRCAARARTPGMGDA
jgi:hypothetical protein